MILNHISLCSSLFCHTNTDTLLDNRVMMSCFIVISVLMMSCIDYCVLAEANLSATLFTEKQIIIIFFLIIVYKII